MASLGTLLTPLLSCRPQDPRYFTLHDLKRARPLAGTLFNVLFNLSKFMAYETRDPFVSRQARTAHRCYRMNENSNTSCLFI